MQIIILGSGTGLPSASLGSPSFVMAADGQHILFDMGPGTLRQLARIGINHDKIDQIFITHFHPDHTADLIHFLFATRHPPTLATRKPFILTAPSGLLGFLDALQKAYGKWLNVPPEIMTLEELDTEKPEKKNYEHFQMMSQPVMHTPASLAYRITGRSGKSFVYSGDTGFCDEIITLAQGTDLFITECSFPDGEGKEGHLTPSLAGRIATLAEVKKLLLVHFYPEVLESRLGRDCRKTFTGELVLAEDLLHVYV